MKLTAREARLVAALRQVLPFAESRAEDMVENVDSIPATQRATRREAKALADGCWKKIEAADQLLNELTGVGYFPR